MLKHRAVLWYVVITVALSFGAYFLPLPMEQKSLLVPVFLVLVPTVVCIPLTYLAEGKAGLRQLFSTTTSGRLKWSLIGALIGVFLHVAVLVAGLLIFFNRRIFFAKPSMQ